MFLWGKVNLQTSLKLKQKVESRTEKMWLEIEIIKFSDITNSYCNDAKNHQ